MASHMLGIYQPKSDKFIPEFPEKDQNKFGQKMLEKMGWSPGKGLGANEQGMTTALRIKYKCDTKGFGVKEQKYEWLQQQANFDDLLASLNKTETNDEATVKPIIGSLEEKSKKTKKMVHYHKRIKGKDISKYSEQDLKCIIGFSQKENDETEIKQNFKSPKKIKKLRDELETTDGNDESPEENKMCHSIKKKKRKCSLEL